MSALATPWRTAASLKRQLAEVEAIRLIGKIAHQAVSEEKTIREIAAAALRVPGVSGIRFESGQLPPVESIKPGQTLSISAVADVKSQEAEFGQLRLFFDPHSHAIESPLRFVRFLAQQAGSAFSRLALLRQLDQHAVRLNTIRRRLQRRKLVPRAAGVFAQQRGLTQSEGLATLVHYARSSRRPLLEVAEAILLFRTQRSQ
jgi:hypothetical protein